MSTEYNNTTHSFTLSTSSTSWGTYNGGEKTMHAKDGADRKIKVIMNGACSLTTTTGQVKNINVKGWMNKGASVTLYGKCTNFGTAHDYKGVSFSYTTASVTKSYFSNLWSTGKNWTRGTANQTGTMEGWLKYNNNNTEISHTTITVTVPALPKYTTYWNRTRVWIDNATSIANPPGTLSSTEVTSASQFYGYSTSAPGAITMGMYQNAYNNVTYTFANWKRSDAGVSVNAGSNLTVTSNWTFYPRFTSTVTRRNYVLTANVSPGIIISADSNWAIASDNTTATMSVGQGNTFYSYLPTVEREGWHCSHWIISSNSTIIDSNTTMPTTDITITPVWIRDKYIVRIYVNGEWKQAIPYIYSNNSWHEVQTFVYNNGWKSVEGI